MNELTKNETFDMQQLMNITGQTALNVNAISKQLGIVASAVDGIRSDVDALTERMDNVEKKEEITSQQAATLNRVIHKRVYDVIGDNMDEYTKYSKIFHASLYTDARKYAGMGNSYRATRKENFQRVIDYVEAWIPSCGVIALKNKADQRAEARRKARALGYLSKN